jgi:ParB/RepB/Spo0J family partition protein
MNKVRVILIEADGSDAIMSQALAGFLAALHPAETPLPPPIPSRPTLELIPSAAPAPAIAERVKPVRVKARQGRLPLAKPDANDGNTRAAVIAALSKRPMTSSELIKETGLTAHIQVLELADGWRAAYSANLPEGGFGNPLRSIDPTYPSRAEAILACCGALITWLGYEKERGSKKHRATAAKLQEWALGLEKQYKSKPEPLADPAGTGVTDSRARKAQRTAPAALPESLDGGGRSGPTPKAPAPETILQTSAIPDGELRMIPLSQLRESPWNPRQHFPEIALAELVESMKASGFRPWLPLLVRPVVELTSDFGLVDNPGLYLFEIGAGHRRRRAAELAGITEIPCLVRPLSDEAFLEVLNFDNSGREDVHPLHEAAGWRQWMEKTGKGVLDIAARIGQSKEYVYQRLKYAALIPEAQKPFLDGEISAAHAVLIARLQPKEQQKALKYALTTDWQRRRPGVRALAEHLHDEAYMSLAECPFDPADASLLSGAGTCAECPKRAANIPGFEFESQGPGDEPAPDLCTDRACYQQKADNHLYRIRTNIYAEEGHFPLMVSESWSTKKKGVHKSGDWEKAKPGDKSAKSAVVVEGKNAGQVIQVRLKQAAPEAAASPRESKEQQERRARRARRCCCA